MRLVLAALCLAASASMASAQTQPNLEQLSASQPLNGGAASPDDNKGQSQSPDPKGPLTTGSGGASGANPQGGTPPNMQVIGSNARLPLRFEDSGCRIPVNDSLSVTPRLKGARDRAMAPSRRHMTERNFRICQGLPKIVQGLLIAGDLRCQNAHPRVFQSATPSPTPERS
jgi:hypothetical protein